MIRRFLVLGLTALALSTAMPAQADEGSPPEWSEAILKLEQQLQPKAFRPSWSKVRTAWEKAFDAMVAERAKTEAEFPD